jgi:uncharacterized protein
MKGILMILSEDSNTSNYIIKGYKPGLITINSESYSESIIVNSQQLIKWPPSSLDDLLAEHLEHIIALKPEIILLGTGIHFKMPPAEQLEPIYRHGMGVECMDTGAACRTFSVLSSEGRNVIAALLID